MGYIKLISMVHYFAKLHLCLPKPPVQQSVFLARGEWCRNEKPFCSSNSDRIWILMGDGEVWRRWSLALCLKCLPLLMMLQSSCRGAVGCVLWRLWTILLAGEEKHLARALRQIISLIQQVTKQWGGGEIMSLEILIDLECSFTLVDEIYSYQVFFVIIIHTIWIWVKACSYFCFLLKPPAVQNLAVASQWICLEANHTRAEYYSLFSKMLLGELQSPTWTHMLCLDFYSGAYKCIKTIIWLDEWRSLYFICVNPNYFRHISEVWNCFFFSFSKTLSLQGLSLYYFYVSEQVCLNIYLYSRCHEMTAHDRDSWHCPAMRLIILDSQWRMLLCRRCFVFWNDNICELLV